MFGSMLLNAVHGGGVEKLGAAGSTLVVPKPLDRQPVGKAAVFDDGNRLDLSTFHARKRLRYRCFFWMR
jgi:hypothetical protein